MCNPSDDYSELKEKIESLKLELETLRSNAMRAMEIKDKAIETLGSNFLMVMEIKDEEVARLTAELEGANSLIDSLTGELERANSLINSLTKELDDFIKGFR